MSVLDVSDAMEGEIVAVDEGVSVAEASAKVAEKGAGCAVVLRKGRRDHVNAIDRDRP